MTEEFFDDLPRTTRRPKEDETSTGDMSELVLPPAAEMLNVDDLLNSSVPGPTESATSVSSMNILADLPPIPAAGDVEPVPATDVVIEPVQLSVVPLSLVHSPASEPAPSHQSAHVSLETLSPIQPEPEPLSFSEAAAPGNQPDSAAESRKKTASFIEKHKPKIVLGALVLAIIGWNHYKKSQQEAAGSVQAPVAQVAPYEAAIQHLQSGPENISHLDTSDPGAALDAAAGSSAGDDLFNGSSDDDKLFATGGQLSEAKSTVSAPIESTPVIPAESAPAPKVEKNASTQVSNELITVKDQLEKMTRERDEWKERAQLAEQKPRDARPVESTKATSASVVKPKVAAEKPVQKVVSTKQPTSKQPTPAAESRNQDVQYLGSFLVRDNWHAHMIIGGTVYEVSSGQKIAGMTISNVSAAGVNVNGREYR